MFAVLGQEETLLIEKLDKIFESWGHTYGARSMIMPFLVPVKDLAKLDVYNNFPHQAMVATSLNLNALVDCPINLNRTTHFNALEPASLSIPSAACYAVYLHFSNQELPDNTLITIMGKCCRKEEKYEQLRRLLGFHMREIVALGTQEYTSQHLINFSEKIFSFTNILDLPIRKEPATDPFYDKNGSRAFIQKLSPVKYEFIFEDIAIASINNHRNFFGERCAIELKNTSTPVFTSCVAFGLERWLSALHRRYGSWDKAIYVVEKDIT